MFHGVKGVRKIITKRVLKVFGAVPIYILVILWFGYCFV